MFYNSILFKMEETFEWYILVEFTLNGKGNIGQHLLSGGWNSTQILCAKIFLSVITKNSNWGIRTKNLVSFKRKDGVKDGKL